MENYFESNDRFSISSPAIEEALMGIRDKIGGSGGSGAGTEAYMENYFETNDRFSISSPVIEELLREIRDAIGGAEVGQLELIIENSVLTGYKCSVIIPDGVTSIGTQALAYIWGLSEITIPDGVTSIGDGAFAACVRLEQIYVPDSVTNIGQLAFSGVGQAVQNAVINCGFAEGAVSGAPWGADTETVTINYNVQQP